MAHRYLRTSILALTAAFASAPLVSAARAADFSAEYVFGDSLSDNGNLAELLNVENYAQHGYYFGNFPNPPSYHDSFTNGPVAVAGLAKDLGLSLTPSLWVTGFKDPAGLFGGPSFVPGTNYAVAGALAATPSAASINLLSQVGAYSAVTSDHADPDALYVIMIGGNDVRDAALDGTGAGAVTAGVDAELAAISTLSGEDAKHFLVVNVPNVGLIPEFAQDNPTLAASATADSQLYDSELAAGLDKLDPSLGAGSTLQAFDLYDFNANILANAALFGLTNTTDRCFTDTPLSAATSSACGPDAENIDSFAYWDDIHPTAKVQALWAAGFSSAVPEPSTWAMLLVGFGSLGLAGYRRGARALAARA
ncbi:MAG TPA: SGNH/GDSL hydrolase family protein [Roseiarcus sp.]|jgi:phospholipase/lecithinase/hemolysin